MFSVPKRHLDKRQLPRNSCEHKQRPQVLGWGRRKCCPGTSRGATSRPVEEDPPGGGTGKPRRCEEGGREGGAKHVGWEKVQKVL